MIHPYENNWPSDFCVVFFPIGEQWRLATTEGELGPG